MVLGRIGIESEGGSWDFDIEVGIDNAAIPASILYWQKKKRVSEFMESMIGCG